MLQIAVVGAGIIGQRHAAAVAQSPDCSLCAVCDIREAAASSLAARYGVPFATDYRTLDADAVILNLPHWLHAEAAVYFLNRGIHVLVEKPMANTAAECAAMMAAAGKSGAKLAVGHLQRFFAANRRVRQLVCSGELGALRAVQEFRSIDYFSPDRPRWFLDKKLSGGGILMNYGAHFLDKLFYITGRTEMELSASVGLPAAEGGVEGHAQLLLRMPDGVGATATFSGYGRAGYETLYCFTDGTAKVVGGTELFLHRDGSWQPEPTDGGDAIALQLAAFCRWLRGEESEIVTAEYAAAVVSLLERAYAL